MDEWSEHTFQVNGVVLHYYHYNADGTKKPPVIHIHGFVESGLCWTPLARALAKNYDVYSYDARGHGHSREPLPPDSFTLENLVSDAASIIKHLNLSEIPAVIGHSMGAHVAALLARAHPISVRALVLEDPAWMSFTAVPLSEEYWRELEEVESKFRAVQQKPASQIIAEGQVMHPKWSDEEFPPWADAQQQINLDLFHNGLDEARRQWRTVPQDLPDIEPPTLLLTGEKRLGSYITQDVAEKAQKSMRQCYHRHFEGVGHYIRREKFDELVAEVTSFLELHHREG